MIVLVLFAIVATTFAACPANYQQINGGDCFRLYTTQQTYASAEAICVQDHGHLASVHSAAEQNALTAIMGATTPLIGMNCNDAIATHCTWADGTASDYNNFPGGTPFLAYGSCVHLATTDQVWYSWNCAQPIAGFICRIPNTPPATTCTGGYSAYNGGCAAVKTVVKTKADAEAICVQEGGHLASIQSDADNTFYQQLATTAGLNSNIYIGLAWNTASNAYTWTDGTVYNYKKFANQFPNTVFGECVQMMLSTEFGTLGQWTNIPCSTQMSYVCLKANTGGDTPAKAPAVCPAIQYYYDKGTLYSANFPASIPAAQSCEYVLVTAVGTKVSVKFPSFSSDTLSSLSIYNGLDDVTPAYRLSGTVNPQVSYESTTNVMKMIFAASANPTGQGWQADFDSLGGVVDPITNPPVDPTAGCPQNQYTADTFVYSPNWPDRYPPMSDCVYYIHAKKANQKLSIQFGYLDTEQCCDFIVVHDGPTNTSPVLATVSGQSTPTMTTYYSTGNTLTLEFFSDSNINKGNGWVASVYNV